MRTPKLETYFLALVCVFRFASVNLACSPTQGFFTIVRFPEVRSKGESLYIYALNTEEVSPEDVTITKDFSSFSSDYVQSGMVTTSASQPFGCYVQINLPSRYSDYYKVGSYSSTLSLPSGAIQQSLALVKSKTQRLNTRGLFSLTVYPASGDPGETRLDPETQVINLPWSPGCDKIKWIKDGRLVNTGRQLKLTKIKNAEGIYNIQQRSRGKRGIFVPFLVVVASCPSDMYFNEDADFCIERQMDCLNGGVGRDKEDSCICPPHLSEPNCAYDYHFVNPFKEPSFMLASGNEAPDLFCADLPGGNDQCKGMLFCLEGLYGCKCAPGWRGSSCHKLCPKGTWGVDCINSCPANCSDCNPFDSSFTFSGFPPLECN